MTDEGHDGNDVEVTIGGCIHFEALMETLKGKVRECDDIGDTFEVSRHKLNPFIELVVVGFTRGLVDGDVFEEIHGWCYLVRRATF